jgi:aconitate hydratase
VAVHVHRVNGLVEVLQARAAVETQLEVDLLRDGGVIPAILQKRIREHDERQSVA